MTPAPFRLTSLATRAGCAAKFSPALLAEVLRDLPAQAHPQLLVDTSTADDAGVYRLSPDLALVQTVDFFPPIVDDPWWYGAIAAANAISDVYAMGGIPITALNLVAFPDEGLPEGTLAAVLQGGAAKAAEAGVTLLGGHTIVDAEPKYGLAVTGTVHPEHIVTNAGARPGDVLVLTKPLGMGVITTAAKRDLADAADLQEAMTIMATLNRDAATAMLACGAHAATDVTGFGLLGHLLEMTTGSGVEATLEYDAIPILAAARRYGEAGAIPGGTTRNYQYVANQRQAVRFEGAALSGLDRVLLADAQTSGGLLIAVAPERADELVARLEAAGTPATARIGRITAAQPGNPPGLITVTR